ncbi:MAG: SlyX protein [Saprospiraceae bacterium]|jgi:SlyX protein
MSEQRIQTVETKLAYLEHTLEELNQVVYKQSIKLEKLESLNSQLNDRLREAMSQGDSGDQANEVPPHY